MSKSIESRMNAVLARPLEVVMEDEIVHTDESPICSDLTCPCNGRVAVHAALVEYHEDGLLSDGEYNAALALL